MDNDLHPPQIIFNTEEGEVFAAACQMQQRVCINIHIKQRENIKF